MQLRLDEQQLEARDRPAAIALSLFTLRLMDRWMARLGDYDCVMIMIAVVVITSERLLRDGIDDHEATLEKPVDTAKLRRCNVASIAEAIGLNRETTRRKVNSLVESGFLLRLEDKTIGLRPGLVQETETRDVLRQQLQDVTSLANQLLGLGILRQR